MCMQLMRYYARLKIEFDSQLSFSRAFMRATGISPTDYRDRFLQKVDFVVEKNEKSGKNPGAGQTSRVLLRKGPEDD